MLWQAFHVLILRQHLNDGAYHDVDSSVLAFEIAARAAFREGMAKASPVLLRTNDESRSVNSRRIYGRCYWRFE